MHIKCPHLSRYIQHRTRNRPLPGRRFKSPQTERRGRCARTHREVVAKAGAELLRPFQLQRLNIRFRRTPRLQNPRARRQMTKTSKWVVWKCRDSQTWWPLPTAGRWQRFLSVIQRQWRKDNSAQFYLTSSLGCDKERRSYSYVIPARSDREHFWKTLLLFISCYNAGQWCPTPSAKLIHFFEGG